MKLLRRGSIVVMVGVISLAGWLCPASAAAKTRYITISTGTIGGTWYPLGGVIAEILSAKVPDLKASATPGGSIKNIRDVNQSQSDIAFVQGFNFFDVVNKKGPFEKEKIENVVGLLGLFPLHYQMAVKKSSAIKTVMDLKDKRISPGLVGGGDEQMARVVLEEYGLSYDKIKEAGGKISFTASGEAVNLIKDGHLDYHGSITFTPAAFFLDLSSVHPIRLLPIDEEVMKRIMNKYPVYFISEIPAKTYNGQDEPVKALAAITALIIRKDLPEDLVYQIVKTIIENADRIAEVHKEAKQISVKTAKQGLSWAPFHPGAEKYFKEKGLK